MRKIALLIFIAFITNACDIFESDAKIYYDTVGEGYVYNIYTMKAEPIAIVRVHQVFASHGWATKQPITETYFADSLGFFRVKFIKKIDKENVVGYTVNAWSNDSSLTSTIFPFTSDVLSTNIKILKIDTLWLQN